MIQPAPLTGDVADHVAPMLHFRERAGGFYQAGTATGEVVETMGLSERQPCRFSQTTASSLALVKISLAMGRTCSKHNLFLAF